MLFDINTINPTRERKVKYERQTLND